MAVPFDTHAVIHQLADLGFSQTQAEGLSAVLAQVVASQEYATKTDIAAVRADIAALRLATRTALTETGLRFDVKLEAIKGDITVLKWGMGLVLGGVLSLVLKTFLHL